MASETSVLPDVQCKVEPSSNVADRLQVYQVILGELKTLDVNSNSPVTINVEEKTKILHEALLDINCTNAELAVVALQVVTYCLRSECLTNFLAEEFSAKVVTTLCELVQSTSDKMTCARIFQCFATQTLKRSVMAEQLQQILTVIKTGQCHKSFQSTQVEFDALGALTRLLDQLPSEMANCASTWAPLVYPLVLHANTRVRERALVAMEKGMAPMISQQNDVARCLANDLRDFLAKELEHRMDAHEEIHALLIWCYYVRLLGTVLHRNSLCNRLLPIVERGFKHASQDVKISAFGAWQALIDNFALVDDYLSEQKRVRLIMQVFSSVQIRSEPLAAMKFRVWWHFVQRLGEKATGLFEQVITPLLQYCFGVTCAPGCVNKLGFKSPKPVASPGVPSITSPLGLLSPNTSPASSSMPVFPSLQRFGCEALTMMLVKANSNEANNCPTLEFTIECLEHDVICRSAIFGKYSATIMTCVRICMVTLAGDVPETMLLNLWHAVVMQVCCLLEQPDNTLKNEKYEAFTALLGIMRDVVTAQSFKPEVMLALIQEVTTHIPQRVMASSSYHIDSSSGVMHGCPSLVLLELLFSHRLMEICSGSECFRELVVKLLRIGLINTAGALGFYQSIYDLLNRSASNVDQLEVLGQIWLVIAASLNEHINKTNEVNQGNNLEHDFSCMHTGLLFPVVHLFKDRMPQTTAKSVLKLWEKLYTSFARLSSMVVNVEANVGCEEFACRAMSAIEELNLKGASFWLSFSELLSCIIQSFDFSSASTHVSMFSIAVNSPGKVVRRKAKLLGNLHSLIGIEVKLLTAMVEDLRRPADSWTITECLPALVSFIAALFQHKQSWSWLVAALNIHAEKLGELYKLSSSGPSTIFTAKVLQKMEKLWTSITGCIQTNATGGFDSDFLSTLSPLLSSVLSHSRRTLRTHAIKFWNQTFALSTVLSYPSCLKPVMAQLKEKNLIMLPSWDLVHIDVVADTPMNDDFSQIELADSEVIVPNIPGVPSPRKSVGSLLQRVQCESPAKRESPAKPTNQFPTVTPRRSLNGPASSVSISSLKSTSTPSRKSASKPDSLFDMSTQDFVPIMSTSEKKQHVLTEHQREMMREKKVLPTMYNNLDASSQSHDVFSHFHVDSSQSQMFTERAAATSALKNIVKVDKNGQALVVHAQDDLCSNKDQTLPSDVDFVEPLVQSMAGDLNASSCSQEGMSVGPVKVCCVRLRRLSNEEPTDSQKSADDLNQSGSSFTDRICESPFKMDQFTGIVGHSSSPKSLRQTNEGSGKNSTPVKKSSRHARGCGAVDVGTPTRQLKIVDMLSNKSPNFRLSVDTKDQCKAEASRKSLGVSEAASQAPVNIEVLVEDSQLPTSYAGITTVEQNCPDIVPMCIEETPPSDSIESFESSEQDASSRQSSVSKRLFALKVNENVPHVLKTAEISAPSNQSAAKEKKPGDVNSMTETEPVEAPPGTVSTALLNVDANNGAESTSSKQVLLAKSDIIVETLSPSEFTPTSIEQMPKKKGRSRKSTGVLESSSQQEKSIVGDNNEIDMMIYSNIQHMAPKLKSHPLDLSLALSDTKIVKNIVTRGRYKQRSTVDNTCDAGNANSGCDPSNSEDTNQTKILQAEADNLVHDSINNTNLSLQQSRRRQSQIKKLNRVRNFRVESETGEDQESLVPKIKGQAHVEGQRDSDVLGGAHVESEADENIPLSSYNKRTGAGSRSRRWSSTQNSLNSSKSSADNDPKLGTVEKYSASVTGKKLITSTSANNAMDDTTKSNADASGKEMDISMETDPEDNLPLSSLNSSISKTLPLLQVMRLDNSSDMEKSHRGITSATSVSDDEGERQSLLAAYKRDEDDLPLKCFIRSSVLVCEKDQRQSCQPVEVEEHCRPKRKSHVVHSPNRHILAVKKAAMKSNAYLRQNKLNLRSKMRQKTGEVILAMKSNVELVTYRSKINTRSRRKAGTSATPEMPRTVLPEEVQLLQCSDGSSKQQEPCSTVRCVTGLDNSLASKISRNGTIDQGVSVSNCVMNKEADDENATQSAAESHTEAATNDVIVIYDSQDVNASDSPKLNEDDGCLSSKKPMSPNTNNPAQTGQEPITCSLSGDESSTVKMSSKCKSLDTESHQPAIVEQVPVASNMAEDLPENCVMNICKNIAQAEICLDVLSSKLSTNSDQLDISMSSDSGIEKTNPTDNLTGNNFQVAGDSSKSITLACESSGELPKINMLEAKRTLGSGDFVVPTVSPILHCGSSNSELVNTTSTLTKAADSAIDLSPDFSLKNSMKFAMPVDRLPVSASDAPPETPTSASRKTFTSRGSLMVQRAKQMQKASASSVVLSRPVEEGSPSTVQRPKSFFQQRVYSPAASPSASILRKRHLIVTDPSVESPSPPNKQRRVCFNDCIETREIPGRRCTTEDADISIVRKQRLTEGSSKAIGLDTTLPRPVNRQLELPGQQAVCRAKQNLASVGSRFGRQQRGRFMIMPSPKHDGTDGGDNIDHFKLPAPSNSESDDALRSSSDDVPGVCPTSFTDSQDLDATPGSSLQPVNLQMTQESQLNSTDPIYASLMDCTTSVKVLLHKLTTPPWLPALDKHLRTMNIISVGDLCSITEQEVHDLPIAQPKIATVHNALDKFAAKYRHNSLVSEENELTPADNMASADRLSLLLTTTYDQIRSLVDLLPRDELADVFKLGNTMTQMGSTITQMCVNKMLQK